MTTLTNCLAAPLCSVRTFARVGTVDKVLRTSQFVLKSAQLNASASPGREEHCSERCRSVKILRHAYDFVNFHDRLYNYRLDGILTTASSPSPMELDNEAYCIP